jgi:L-threonylcarbamoyladenylate synthase
MPVPDLTAAVRALRAGRLVVMPTETVYGLAADAFNVTACARIFALKGRPRLDPLIVHVADAGQVARVARRVPAALQRLAETFWPGPLTLVVPRHRDVPDIVTAGLPTVAVRVPAHPLAQRLLRAFAGPLAAPSANRFGRVSPTSADHVRAEFGKRTPLLLDGGPCRHGLESTIVTWRNGRLTILREGSLSREAIEQAAGQPVRVLRRTVLTHPDAPGLLKHHYAPRARLVLLPPDWRQCPPSFRRGDALLLFSAAFPAFAGPSLRLAPRGSTTTAARHLYAALRLLDRSGVSTIYAETVPDTGLGAAINDRLRRASA